MKNQTCIILAAGRSQRFPSPFGKICYPFRSRPLIDHILQSVTTVFHQCIVVISPKIEKWFQEYFQGSGIEYVIQHEPLGTWDALSCAFELIKHPSCVIVNGDLPLISEQLLLEVADMTHPIGVVTTHHPNPYGYGRIVRNEENNVLSIIEDKDLKQSMRNIHEINAGVYFFETKLLKSLSVEKALSCNEWYLTDIWKTGSPFLSMTQFIVYPDYRILQGINTWAEYELAENFFFQIQRERAVQKGAILENCSTIYLDSALKIESGVRVQGPVVIGPNTDIKSEATIESFSLVNHTALNHRSYVGPFAKITDGTTLEASAHIGSFVEVKRSSIGFGSKAKHFSYLADMSMGSRCNIGAFVVTCNYDGKCKNKTILEDDVFVGSSSQLIAPITLNHRSYIGAGTTLNRNVPQDTLLTRRAVYTSRPYLKGAPLCVELLQD